MSDAEDQNQAEPTMEEILASIRRIISEDAPEGEEEAAEEEAAPAEEPVAEAEPEPEPEPGPEPEPEVEPEPEPEPDAEPGPEPDLEPEPEPEPEEEEEDVLELTNMVSEDGSVVDLNAEREAQRAREEPAPADPPPTDPSLLSDMTRSAATSALLELATTADGKEGGPSIVGGNRTLEMLVVETLEPHLKVWLDANLPGLVERIVREEIQKMVKRAEYR